MKKYLAFVVAFVMVATYMVCPSMAIDIVETDDDVLKINDIYIPMTAESVQEGSSTVFYNFYDYVNDMHYAFYNIETGEHFAMSGPRYVDVSDVTSSGARSSRIVAHYYSFSGRYTINGKDNGVTFTLPADKVYLSGSADIKRYEDDRIVSDEYENGFLYGIEVVQEKFWFPQSVTFDAYAGKPVSENFTAEGGTYYLIIHPGRWTTGSEYIEGNGSLYYYV